MRWRRRLTRAAIAVGVLAAGAYAVLQTPPFGGSPTGARQARIELSRQCRDGQLRNTQTQWIDFIGAAWTSATGASPDATPSVAVDVVATDPFVLARPSDSGLRDLPAVDAVVISHEHFDHLDELTIRAGRPSWTGGRTRRSATSP